MPQNVYDQASRYLAKIDDVGFLAWLLNLTLSAFNFSGWLDTRRISFPGEPDRLCDTVAHLEDVARGQLPWAAIVEFQLEPDPLMFGRFLVYGGLIWLEIKPSPERGDRFHIGGVVVNLTGNGDAAREMNWPEAGLLTALRPREINLSTRDAKTTLDAIAAGDVATVILALIPLMQGGDEPSIIQQWLNVAVNEPDARRRSDYGHLAQIFADAAGHADVWKQALKGWNMIESKVVTGWQNEARVKLLVRQLRHKFGPLPSDLEARLLAESTTATIENWSDLVVSATTLEEFRQAASL